LAISYIVHLVVNGIAPYLEERALATGDPTLYLAGITITGFLKYFFLSYAVSPVFVFVHVYIISYIVAYLCLLENNFDFFSPIHCIYFESTPSDYRIRTFIVQNIIVMFGVMLLIFKILTLPYSPSPKTSLIFIENYFIVWQFTLEYILVLLLVSIALTSQILTKIRKLYGDLTVKLPSSILSFITLLIGEIESMSMLVVLFVSIYLVVWDLVFSIVLTFYAIMI